MSRVGSVPCGVAYFCKLLFEYWYNKEKFTCGRVKN